MVQLPPPLTEPDKWLSQHPALQFPFRVNTRRYGSKLCLIFADGHPTTGESIFKLLPIVAPLLALSIEPFIHELHEPSSEIVAHLPVVRDRVVVQMPY